MLNTKREPQKLRMRISIATVCVLLSLSNVFKVSAREEKAQQIASAETADITDSDPQTAAAKEAQLLSGTRQLIFEGRRSGEGYFSHDGSKFVFQSEREAGNPFFQIYLMDLKTGQTNRISPGRGKTTCAWIHPTGNKVLFASTHEDAAAGEKQRAELQLRQSGKERRYSWDFDEHFDLFEFDVNTKHYRRLTEVRGYDAEGSWSPDAKLIAFTSNRRAYDGHLSAEDKKHFDVDPAYMNDIFLMDSDGNNVRQLTSEPGYDGGPFFSPNGKRICWRRFTPNGLTAEVWTMNVDGSDKRQITHLGAMSWAPFYHPSGEYLIFTTNLHGFSNFELYLVDVEGKSKPVRVTYSKGFDGLPAFSPDGNALAWTSSRTPSEQSQIFLAHWNHERTRELLGLKKDAAKDLSHASKSANAESPSNASSAESARSFAETNYRLAVPEYSPADIRRHVEYLCRDGLEGRFTGSPGERLATEYVAAYMEKLGLAPAGDDGGWFQPFEFTAGVALSPGNELVAEDKSYRAEKDWLPLSFSATGEFKKGPVVFAGYGLVADAAEKQPAYDSYTHLDAKDKWVLVFRYLPENAPEKRPQLSRASQLRFKATYARDHGARGLIVVTGPNAQARRELVPLQIDGTLGGSGLPVVSITNELASEWLSHSHKSLKQLQDELDDGKQTMGFEIPGAQISAKIQIKRIKTNGRNVLGRLAAANNSSDETVVIGAHVDHLGKGATSSSLARAEEAGKIHYGADDNASGVAALLEVSEHLADEQKRAPLHVRRDIVFAAWSGEELGLLGSDHFVKSLAKSLSTTRQAASSNAKESQPIYPSVAAYLNMDMVGRLRKSLILQGIGSSTAWRREIEQCNVAIGLPLTLQDESYLPTDATSFYLRGVPILAAFTGAHSEYHTPRDTPEKLNYEGASMIAQFMGDITLKLAEAKSPPEFVQQAIKQQTTGGRLRTYLGTIPDYAEEVKGVMLSAASKGGPADKAGLKSRDVIVELAGKKIENIYDYTNALEALKIGQPATIVVLRDGKRVPLQVTPQSRD